MDDRQTQIREGAGLEESRINRDLIDFLNKWSSPVLFLLAGLAAAWWGMQQLEKRKIAKIDRAFSDLDTAFVGGNPSPDSLQTLATEYEGVRAVPEMALLTTTDIYLGAFIRGVEPGAQLDRVSGQPMDEADKLDETQRGTYLSSAGDLAQRVVDMTQDNDAKAMLTVQALVRLAVVSEGKRDFDAAKAHYSRAAEIAQSNGFPILAQFATNRAADVETLGEVDALPSRDELTALPGEAMDMDTLNELLNASTPLIESAPSDSNAEESEIPSESQEEDPAETPTTDTP
jgi:hypothetical protein